MAGGVYYGFYRSVICGPQAAGLWSLRRL